MSDRLDTNSVKAAFGKIAEAAKKDSTEADAVLIKSGLALACDLVLTLHDIRDALLVLAVMNARIAEPHLTTRECEAEFGRVVDDMLSNVK